MIDLGSDTNFVRNKFARQMELRGEPCHFCLKVVDIDARPLQTTKYQFDLEDHYGNHHAIVAMGLDEITSLPPDPDLGPIQDLVQGYPREVLQRPQGEVDILLGLHNSALHGSTAHQWGNLLESPLGCGWSLCGTHPALQYPLPQAQPLDLGDSLHVEAGGAWLLRGSAHLPHCTSV